MLTEYEKAPNVTRQRLYIDAIESVLTNSQKVILDTEGSGNLMYLPIDKLIQQSTGSSASSAQGVTRTMQPAQGGGSVPRQSDDLRVRRTR